MKFTKRVKTETEGDFFNSGYCKDDQNIIEIDWNPTIESDTQIFTRLT